MTDSKLAKQVSNMDSMRKKKLGKAFNLIDKQNAGSLNKEQCIQLFEELNNYRSLPKMSREEFELIFDELDDSHDFKINLDEFAGLCNAIALRFQKEDSLDINNNSAQKAWQVVEFVFGWIYMLEMAFKVYAFGFENYWRDGQNLFDFLITWISGGIVYAGNPKLESTELAEDDYLLFNFNDYPNGMVTLFNLLVLGNWQVWTQVIAFVLEAFFAEMDLETSETCEEDKEERAGKERRRSVGTRTRSQRVDVLLHHMLSAELERKESVN